MFRGTTLLPAIRQALGMRNVHVRLLLLGLPFKEEAPV